MGGAALCVIFCMKEGFFKFKDLFYHVKDICSNSS